MCTVQMRGKMSEGERSKDSKVNIYMLKLPLINSIKQMEYGSVTMCCKVMGGWQILLMNHREDTIGKMKTCQDNR